MQSAKYTSISDIVIYSENGGYTAEAVELAKRARLAMIESEKDRLERGDDQCLSYEVYVVTGEHLLYGCRSLEWVRLTRLVFDRPLLRV